MLLFLSLALVAAVGCTELKLMTIFGPYAVGKAEVDAGLALDCWMDVKCLQSRTLDKTFDVSCIQK
jgi:hypothetical protein